MVIQGLIWKPLQALNHWISDHIVARGKSSGRLNYEIANISQRYTSRSCELYMFNCRAALIFSHLQCIIIE